MYLQNGLSSIADVASADVCVRRDVNLRKDLIA